MWLFKTRNKLPQSDAEIISAYKKSGDKQLIGILFERYAHLVYGVCYGYIKDQEVCKDATLNIFEKLFTDLKKHEITNFSSWLHSVARNYCFAYIKTNNRMIAVDASCLCDIAIENDDISNDEYLFKHLDQLPNAIANLSSEQQQCITLFYLHKKSYFEIAAQTEFNLNQVKSYIQNGKRNLKIYLTTLDKK